MGRTALHPPTSRWAADDVLEPRPARSRHESAVTACSPAAAAAASAPPGTAQATCSQRSSAEVAAPPQVHAGRLKYYLRSWRAITNNDYILDAIAGYSIPFITVPNQCPEEYPKHHFSVGESSLLKKEIEHLLDIKAIRKCNPVSGQFVSDIFLVPKKDGSMRLILNLKKLNKYVSVDHFKMEDIRTAIKLVTEGCFMANIDLHEAYFLVPIHSNHKKYLRFYFNGFYEFNALPFGLCSAPYIFTKILQPVITHLRARGFKSVRYLDDICLLGYSREQCLDNVKHTVECLTNLGFVINYKKSCLEPKKSCNFLGFVINSESMTLELPERKRNSILVAVDKLLIKKSIRIRDFARVLGSLTAACPAVAYGWLYTKSLERARYLALLNTKDNYDKFMAIPDNLRDDLLWWKKHILTSVKSIQQCKYEMEIYTDASTTGWGAACNGEKTGGFWTEFEYTNHHINYLELLAVYFGLKSFASKRKNCSILMRVDNTTAISYVNKMGGVQYPHLNKVANMIWKWCEERGIFIFASYIKSSLNTEADSESRKLNIDTEWELAAYAYSKIINTFGHPHIDLFASRANAKCNKYISWKRDPDAHNIDAFTIDWAPFFFYAFPPFALILKMLNKIIVDGATGIVVVPQWPSQPWYPLFQSLAVSDILILPPDKYLLTSPFRSTHPLYQQISLAASVLSGKDFSNKAYRFQH